MARMDSIGASAALISADAVQGTDVYNLQGDKIGHVEDIMLHKVSGKVAYAVMAFGGFLGIGERYHPLPWTLLTYDTGRGGYTVPMDKDRLMEGPSFERAQLTGDDMLWRDKIHSYYQATPYWS